MSDSVMRIDKLGTKRWTNSSGQFHRTDGPAIEYLNGDKEWWVNGKLHRTDGPAIEYLNGDKEWWVNGYRHREDGPAAEYVNGNKVWYVNGKYHRTDGPAVEGANGYRSWWVNDRHLGFDDEGFWSLWERLTPKQKKDPVLLRHLPEKF